MRAQKASTPVKLAALAAGAALVVLAVVVGLRLAGKRDEGPPAASLVKPPPEDRVVDVKEQVRHQEFKDGKLVADTRSGSFYRDPDGRNHLKGAVDITNLGPGGEVLSKLTADEVVYDPATLLFNIGGRVRVESGGVILEGGSFEYDKPKGLFGTRAGGDFSSKTMRGHAAEISYDENADEVRLSGGFRVEMGPAEATTVKTVLSGESLLFRRNERRGRAEGRVEFSGGRCRGSAEAMEFDVAEGSSLLTYVVFDRSAELAVTGTRPGRAEGGGIRADRILAAFLPGSDSLSTVNALGKSRLSLSLSTASTSLVEASTALLKLRTGEEIERLDASGGCRASLDDENGEARLLEGESLSYDASTRLLEVSGTADRPASAESSDVRIEAPAIVAGPAAGDLEASGGVMCLLRPSGARRAPGFFSASEPVIVSCDRLVFRRETGVSSFVGGVRARQGRDFLTAGALDLMDVTRDMRGGGGVAVDLAQAVAAGGSERRVEIGGDDMTYSASAGALSLKGKSYVRLPDAKIEAGTVAVTLGPEGRGVEKLAARAGVVLSKGRYEGRGDEALYEAAAGRVTLTGRPVLVDKEGGSIRGDKLTFDLGDDKILVENEGQGRSTTVIKS